MFHNSQSAFIGLFFLAVFQPFDFQQANQFMGIVFFLILLISCFVTFRQKGYSSIKPYRIEIALISAFLLLNMTSTLANLNHYPLAIHLVTFSLASMVVWCSIFLAAWLFAQLQTQHSLPLNALSYFCNQYAGWLFLTLLTLVALWQIIDYSSASLLTQYFVSRDAIANHSGAISSVTRWHTVYGSICACALVALLSLNIDGRQKPKHFMTWCGLIILSCLLFYTGLLSKSRNFIWILGVGCFSILCLHFKTHWKSLLAFILAAITITHLLLLQNHSLLERYEKALPYLEKISQAQLPEANDFIPRFNQHGLTARNQLWQQGVELWQQQKWFGIGTGAFRALNYRDVEQRNLHNYFFQVLVETGIIGFSVLILLIFRLFQLASKHHNQIILLTILSALIFDNFIDYSFAFCVFCAWLILQTRSKNPSTY